MMLENIKANKFIFEELVKRDFVKKYKRTVLGMAWSMLSPLFNLLVLWFVFNSIFGNDIEHYVIYLFAGQIVFNYFVDATNTGMMSIYNNSEIICKIKVPKQMFILSQQISSLINFLLTLVIFFVFVAIDGVEFSYLFLFLIVPIVCLVVFNYGVGLILSSLFVFFRDIQYFWTIATQLIMWVSAIFYSIDIFPSNIQKIFGINPLYVFITSFREIVIYKNIPSISLCVLMVTYALISLLIGKLIYKKYDNEFLYYL